jgi:hypothetical protein
MVLNSKKGIEFINTKFLSKCPLLAGSCRSKLLDERLL